MHADARVLPTDSVVGAWAHLGVSDSLIAAAAATDQMRGNGLAGGELHPLFGIPFGAKDIIQSRDFPTEYGSEIFRGNPELNQPGSDAACIAHLKSVGAILLVSADTAQTAHLPRCSSLLSYATTCAAVSRAGQDRHHGIRVLLRQLLSQST